MWDKIKWNIDIFVMPKGEEREILEGKLFKEKITKIFAKIFTGNKPPIQTAQMIQNRINSKTKQINKQTKTTSRYIIVKVLQPKNKKKKIEV